MLRKTFDLDIVEKSESGGRIVISTSAVDRDRDRVMPHGARLDNYMKNPVVQWGHNYREPWATIGKTTSITIEENGIVADFELRPAANEQDPQNIVLLLWGGGWIKSASVGFMPIEDRDGEDSMIPRIVENNDGGYDYNEWELLEWSLVPIPANQEALRLMGKSLEQDIPNECETVESLEEEGQTETMKGGESENTEANTDADSSANTDAGTEPTQEQYDALAEVLTGLTQAVEMTLEE